MASESKGALAKPSKGGHTDAETVFRVELLGTRAQRRAAAEEAAKSRRVPHRVFFTSGVGHNGIKGRVSYHFLRTVHVTEQGNQWLP